LNAELIANLKVFVLVALIGLLAVSYFFEDSATRRLKRSLSIAFGVVALLAILGYFNFGFFRYLRPNKFVHSHEQFHHYLGAEYLEELRYDGLYLATALAAREDSEGSSRWRLRDPLTNMISLARYQNWEADDVKQRFSEERWDRFKADRRFFFHELRLGKRALLDHANTGSPSWAALASLLTRPLGTGLMSVHVYALVDPLLLLVLFLTVWRSFGARVACIVIVIGLLPPHVYDYLGGSLLRLDWLFAVGMSACCFKTGRYKTAGVFLGYAVSTKIFCGLIALALGLSFIIDTLRTRRLKREHVALVVASVASLGAFVTLGALFFGGFDIWADYWERILATYHEKYYTRNYSLRDLFLQARHGGLSVFGWAPEQIAAGLRHVNIRNHESSFWITRLAIVAGFVFVLARHEILFAFGIGVLLVFVVLVTNLYYWQMLLLLALVCACRYREDPRKLLYLMFLCVVLIAEHLFAPTAESTQWGFCGSYWLGLMCLFVFLVELSTTRNGTFRFFRTGTAT